MKKWTRGIRGQLLIMGAFPVIILTTLVYISMNALSNFSDRLDKSYNVRSKLIESAGEIDSSIHALGRWMWLSYVTKDKEDTKNNFLSKAEGEIEQFETTKEAYLKLPRNERIKELFKSVEKDWPIAKEAALEAIKMLKGKQAKDSENIKNLLLTKFATHLVPITKVMNEIKEEMHQILEKEISNANEFSNTTTKNLLITSILSMLICFALSIFIAINLAKKLTNISTILHEASTQVYSASNQIAASSEELSQAATEQAAALEQTAASLEEISSMINKTADSSKQASASSAESQSKAEEGKASIGEMLTSMDEIKQSNDSIMTQINYSNQQLSEIVKVIQEIGEKTKVINDIVFQTKLLSFNASVEAARAGEHGKGFAVVAEEVGNLAQMSGNAAREISDMLTGSISKVEKIVQETKLKVETLVSHGKQKVEIGVSVAEKCATVLTDIVENISKAAHYTHEISSASQEQSLGVNEINKAMSQMDTVTQQNAATSEQTASAAEELSGQSLALSNSVEDLLKIIEGNSSNHQMNNNNDSSQYKNVSNQNKSSNSEHLKTAKSLARVIHLKSKRTKQNTETLPIDESNSIPDRNHVGFKEV